MSDILVRVPQKEIAHFWEPIFTDEIAWWTLPCQPVRCGKGDRIWFQIGDEVVARARISWIEHATKRCESTGRIWRGVHLGWSGGDLERLEVPREGKGLTRGFMYYEEE